MSNRAKKMMGAGLAALAAAQIAGDVQAAVTAAGTTQANATVCYGDNIVVTTCAAGAGIVLASTDPFGPGDSVFVANQGANACLVYPPSGGQINALAVNAGFSVAAGKSALLVSQGNNTFCTLLSA